MISTLAAKLIRPTVMLVLLLGLIACSGPESDDPATGTSDAATSEATSASNTPQATTPTGGSSSDTAPTTGASDPSATATEATSETPSVAVESPTTMATETATAEATRDVDLTGALLPHNRIVAFYGHPNSTAMGILGEFSKEEVHRLLAEQAAEYEAIDPSLPTVLAFELIATVAQPWPGDDGTYVAYTGDEIIQEYVDYVTANDMILILDLQIGHDTIVNQINVIRHWLELPNVHVAIDPEFSMKANEIVPRDRIPGEFIGESNGIEIQQGMELLAQIAAEAGIPPKVLIVHQFEEDMIYNKDQITPVPGVQFVLDMDGFGSPEAKIGNYGHFVQDQLIEYGGIKMFYRQDDPILTPAEIVALQPTAYVVIYQ